MRLFGIEIKKANTVSDKVSQAMTPTWSAGLEHTTPSNYDAMVKAYHKVIGSFTPVIKEVAQ